MSTDSTTQSSFWRNADAMARSAEVRKLLFSPPALKMIQLSGILRAKGPLRVLDNGSGDGIVAQQVWDSLADESRSNLDITCADLSPAMAKLAEQRIESGGWPTAKALVMDMQDMKELADSTFTHCFSGFAIQFAPKHDLALGEIKRVCMGDAVIGLTTWKQFGWAHYVREALARVSGCPAFPDDAGLHAKLHWGNPWYSENFVRTKLEEHGFASIRFEESVDQHTLPAPVFAATGAVMVKPMLGLFWNAEAVQKFGDDIQGALLRYFEAHGLDEVTFINVALVAVARAPSK